MESVYALALLAFSVAILTALMAALGWGDDE